ncbi:MAG: hypothetical protein AAF211_28080 [Myxococcota bacterium]
MQDRSFAVASGVFGLWAAGIGGLRFAELSGTDVPFLAPGYPSWLIAYLGGLQLTLVVLGTASVLHAPWRRLAGLGRPLAAAIVATTVVHGAFLLFVDLAQGQGGFVPAILDVVTLVRRHDPTGATPTGRIGYRMGQLAALASTLAWPAAVLGLDRARRLAAPVRGTGWAALGLGVLLSVVVSGAAVFAPRPPSLVAEVPPGWRVVADPTGASQLPVPPDWEIREGETLFIVDEATGPHANCNLMAFSRPDHATLTPEARQVALEAELDDADYDHVRERRPMTIAGRPGLFVVVDRTSVRPLGNLEVRHAQWQVPTANALHQLTCTTYPSNFEERRPTFETVARHWVVGE